MLVPWEQLLCGHPMTEPVYKICPAAALQEARESRRFGGSADDARDGFIHLSAGHQVAGTLAKYFAGQRDLVLLAVDPAPAWKAPSLGGIARRRAVPASLRAARPRPCALGQGVSAARGRHASPARRRRPMNALYGLGQALLHALDPERAHDLPSEPRARALSRAAVPDDPRSRRLRGVSTSAIRSAWRLASTRMRGCLHRCSLRGSASSKSAR